MTTVVRPDSRLAASKHVHNTTASRIYDYELLEGKFDSLQATVYSNSTDCCECEDCQRVICWNCARPEDLKYSSFIFAPYHARYLPACFDCQMEVTLMADGRATINKPVYPDNEPVIEEEKPLTAYEYCKSVILSILGVTTTKEIKAWMKQHDITISLATNVGWERLRDKVEDWDAAGRKEPSDPRRMSYEQIKPIVLARLGVADTKAVKKWMKEFELGISLATTKGWQDLLIFMNAIGSSCW